MPSKRQHPNVKAWLPDFLIFVVGGFSFLYCLMLVIIETILGLFSVIALLAIALGALSVGLVKKMIDFQLPNPTTKLPTHAN